MAEFPMIETNEFTIVEAHDDISINAESANVGSVELMTDGALIEITASSVKIKIEKDDEDPANQKIVISVVDADGKTYQIEVPASGRG